MLDHNVNIEYCLANIKNFKGSNVSEIFHTVLNNSEVFILIVFVCQLKLIKGNVLILLVKNNLKIILMPDFCSKFVIINCVFILC